MGAVLSELYKAFSTTNPGGEPRNAEAKRQLLFFANSLHNRRLAPPPPVAQMRTWSAFTPHYAEDVKYSTAALLGSYADEASPLGAAAVAPSGRMGKSVRTARHAADGADRASPCERAGRSAGVGVGPVAGAVSHGAWRDEDGDALRVLARLEGVPEPAVEALVASKFEYVVASQIYDTLKNKSKKEDDKWKARSIDELRHTFRQPSRRLCRGRRG